MPNAMWLRGEVFDHGLLHLSLLERDPEPSSASTGRAFDRIGRCLIGLRSRGLGGLLLRDELGASAKLLHAVWNEAAEPGDSAISENQSACLVQIFAALRPRAWRSDRQAEAEFVLFLAVQLFFHSHTHLQRDDQICWPATAPEGGAPPPLLSPAEQHQRVASLAGDEPRPAAAGSPRASSSPRSLALRAISHENDERLAFVKAHIRDIFWLISLCDGLSARSSFLERWNLQELTADVVCALGFLVSDGKDMRQLCHRQESRISCLELEMLLGRSLVINDDANPRPGVALDPDTPVPDDGVSEATEVATDDDDDDDDDDDVGDEAASAGRRRPADPAQPDASRPPQAHRNLTIYNARRRTVVETFAAGDHVGASPQGASRDTAAEDQALVDKLAIFACKNSYIYALVPSRHVRIVGCTDSTIVLGPCAQIVTIEHCSKVEIMGITRHLSIGNAYDCKINMHALDAKPVLFGDCRGLEVGPYNTYYPRLGRHLALAGINARTTFPTATFHCLQPLDITVQTGVGCAWTRLQPAEFAPFVVPFPEPALSDACKDNPVGLPPEYAQSLYQKVDRVESLLRRFSVAYSSSAEPGDGTGKNSDKDSDDSDEVSRGFLKGSGSPTSESKQARAGGANGGHAARKLQLEQAFQDAFREWLASSGNARQVVDLFKLHPGEDPSATSSFPTSL